MLNLIILSAAIIRGAAPAPAARHKSRRCRRPCPRPRQPASQRASRSCWTRWWFRAAFRARGCASAWATGNVASISYATLARRDELYSDAMMSPAFSAKYGLPNIKDSIANLWITEARTALANNASTVAFVPMEHLTGPSGLMDRLRAMGYTVSSP